ncbi:ABC transporter permease [Gudongella sp. DL1XJH-153]|uniref:ABC transporter permease n=1 Tax=Gudongella sp. DL1XJH-153 TaxID=3409804 RepID=UPI003BB6689E
MIQFALRSLKIFFRDKSAVFFSLLAVFIIIGLYVLFLGDMVSVGEMSSDETRFLMDSWIMGGLLAVTSMTTTMGAFGIMVDDQHKKLIKDFNSSPIKRSEIVGGYLLSTFSIGIIITLIALILGQGYIVFAGGEILNLSQLARVCGVLILSVLASSSMVALLVSFFKSNNAFSAASTVIGTLIGFLTGIYVPIGVLPASVQTAIKLFPISHAAALFRQIYTEVSVIKAFEGAPAQVINDFNIELGIVFKAGEKIMEPIHHILVLVATTVVFFGISVYRFNIKKD